MAGNDVTGLPNQLREFRRKIDRVLTGTATDLQQAFFACQFDTQYIQNSLTVLITRFGVGFHNVAQPVCSILDGTAAESLLVEV